jgi:hypothetical protein
MNDLSQPHETKLTLGELVICIPDAKDVTPQAAIMLKTAHFTRIDAEFHPLLINGWIDCLQEILRELDKDSRFISKYATDESGS